MVVLFVVDVMEPFVEGPAKETEGVEEAEDKKVPAVKSNVAKSESDMDK